MNARQLKSSILQLAVSGKLVPQNPTDEPAAALLKRIRAEKERLIKSGKIKREKRETKICRKGNSFYEVAEGKERCIDDEIPFEIPESWEWARLNEICAYIQRGKSPKYSLTKKYPVIAQKCIQWSGFSIEKAQFIEPASLSSYADERILQDDDLMWNSTGLGTLGRLAIYKKELNPYELAVADSHVTVFRPLKKFIDSSYLYFYFANPTVQLVIEDLADGTTKQKELATATIKNYLVPIPPLEEQRRIVEKLETILPLAGKYGEVEKLLDGIDADFPERLKKSVLQLAVQGKLVPQNPDDEPAITLLKKIRAEKNRLVQSGKLKRDKTNSVIRRSGNSFYETIGKTERNIDEDLPFEIPESWEWVRLGNYAEKITDQVASGSFASLRANVPSLKTPDYAIMVKTADFNNNFSRNLTYTTKHGYEFLSNSNLFGGELILSNIGSIGKCFIVPKLDYKMTLAPNSVMVRLTDEEERDYLYYFILSPQGFQELTEITSGTAMKKFSKTDLKTILVPIPPLAEQKRIVEKIEEILPLIENLQQQ